MHLCPVSAELHCSVSLPVVFECFWYCRITTLFETWKCWGCKSSQSQLCSGRCCFLVAKLNGSMYFDDFRIIFLSVLQLLHSLFGDLGAWTLLQTGCEPLCQCHCQEISRTWVTYARLFQSQTDLENPAEFHFRLWFPMFFWDSKGNAIIFLPFFLYFLVWKFGQDLREAVRKLEADTVRGPNAGVTKSQKALSKGRERRFLRLV